MPRIGERQLAVDSMFELKVGHTGKIGDRGFSSETAVFGDGKNRFRAVTMVFHCDGKQDC